MAEMRVKGTLCRVELTLVLSQRGDHDSAKIICQNEKLSGFYSAVEQFHVFISEINPSIREGETRRGMEEGLEKNFKRREYSGQALFNPIC